MMKKSKSYFENRSFTVSTHLSSRENIMRSYGKKRKNTKKINSSIFGIHDTNKHLNQSSKFHKSDLRQQNCN